MTIKSKTAMVIFFGVMSLFSCNQNKESSKKEEDSKPKIKEESVGYTDDTADLKGYVVYDENMEGKRPAVLVVHEWWGLMIIPVAVQSN